MSMRVVAAPVRYRRLPLILLLLIGALPAIGLVVLNRWAAGEADRYDASRQAVAVVSGDANGLATEQAKLSADMLDYRRAPASVARLASVNELRRELRPHFQFVSDQSCAMVSVDGVRVGATNASVPVIPASIQKLITAAVALEVIGPKTRFITTVLGAQPEDGVVTGDIYLVGGGDPLLTSDDYPIEDDTLPAFNTTSLDSLANRIVAAGVTRIDGAVIGDGSRYDDEYSVDSWATGVAFVDAGPYDALIVNDSRRVGYSSRQTNPNTAAANELVRLLAERGVVVGRGATSGIAPIGLDTIATVRSARLAAVIKEMLVNSDNNTAEMLLKEIGHVARGQGTRVAGLNVVDATLRSWGVPMDGVRGLDGSGLSPGNRVTCAAILSVLQHDTAVPLRRLLPVAGESGTLMLEFIESPMAGRMHAKTGTLNNMPVEEFPPAVKALAGYVDSSTPATIEFVMILNTPDITVDRRFAPLWQSLGSALATYPQGPLARELAPS